MGGALAGLYASMYTDEIHSVTMICPASKYVWATSWENLSSVVCDLVKLKSDYSDSEAC